MVNTAVSLFVFLLARIWCPGAPGNGTAQSSHLELARDVFCSWDFRGCKVPSHPEGPAFPSEKNLPANTGQRRGEQQELFPPNCLQDSFGTMSTVRPSTRQSQCHRLKKVKTFSVESYITDQLFTKFLYEEILPSFLAPHILIG